MGGGHGLLGDLGGGAALLVQARLAGLGGGILPALGVLLAVGGTAGREGGGLGSAFGLDLAVAFRGQARPLGAGLLDDLGEGLGDQGDRADGIVIARDDVVDRIRIGVGVDNGHDRNAHAVGLGDGDGLAADVEHDERARHLLHVRDAAQAELELVELAPEAGRLLLEGRELTVVVAADGLDLAHAADAAADCLVVRQRAAQPADGHVELAAVGRGLGDDLLRLALGGDEKDLPAVEDRVAEEGGRGLESRERLGQVDDVDAVALVEDEGLHLRIPAPGLVAEMQAGVQQILQGQAGQAGRCIDVHVAFLR